MTTNKSLWVALIVIVIIAIGGYSFPKAQIAQQSVKKFGQISDLFTMNRMSVTDIDNNQTAVTSTLNGTTTIASSYDGHVDYGAYTMSTGTVRALYTNSTHGPEYCFGASGAVIVRNNGSFTPSLTFSLGTSTSATVYSANLLASSTVATTTNGTIASPAIFSLLSSKFLLMPGESIVSMVGDITNNNASSTYYGNETAEARVSCSLIGA